jgi:cysteate synthase
VARHYRLACSGCERTHEDDGLILQCPAGHAPALLRTEYRQRGFKPVQDGQGLSRYHEWLPVTGLADNAHRGVVYRSEALSTALGLPNLWIAFNGYWPERGAMLGTGTFKEFEAYTVLGRMPKRQSILTVPSSGNTAAAFAWACSQEGVPCLLIVPETALHRLRFRAPLDPCVSVVAIGDSDYSDAMDLAASVCRTAPFQAEGGVKNVGRRDGLGTVMLTAHEEMRSLPTHYFQAVGSGTGAIAVHEAAKRLRAAGAEMTALPRLMLCQNRPFTPIHHAWEARSPSLDDASADRFRAVAKGVHADELTNSTPPYAVRGGVYDALVESRGDVLTADSGATRAAQAMFEELEGIDIEPAAGVALACLRDAVRTGKVDRASVVLLNVTGGGRARLALRHTLVPADPKLRLARDAVRTDRDLVKKIAEVCASAVPVD